MEAAAYAPKPKGERARILELEARLSHLVTGGGASTPSVCRGPAMYKWCGAVGRPAPRSASVEPRRSSSRRSLPPLQATGRADGRSSVDIGMAFGAPDDIDHLERGTIFGVVRPLAPPTGLRRGSA